MLSLYLADIDPDTDGNQQYENCDGITIDTLEQAFWCGPSQTWPQFEYNHAYIDFWHHLDWALAGEIPGVNVDQIDLGPAAINDEAWAEIFGIGTSFFNGITVQLSERNLGVDPLSTDQLGNARPADTLADIGAVEVDN